MVQDDMTTASDLYRRARQVLAERFGHNDFRTGQAAIIEAVLAGQDVLAVMPTGSGKSLCYQLPALLKEGCTLVISPLIALMKDQVDALHARGIAATFINSSLSWYEQQDRLRDCRNGTYQLLYIAPERFRSGRFWEGMAQTRVSLLAVDEAHCISEWGHDFRPDYLRLRETLPLLQNPQVLALTATATVEVQHDIMQQLGCKDMRSIVYGFDRSNLTYRVYPVRGQRTKMQALSDILTTQEEGSVIIYAATRRAVEEITKFLQQRGIEALSYHAGLPDHVRHKTQEQFMEHHSRLIVATNAFGMGVDKADVRCVVHFNIPRTLEAYYQEAGRAGRDGLPAECILLFSYADVKIQEFLLEQSYPTREAFEHIYEIIASLSQTGTAVPWQTLRPRSGRVKSEMQLGACIRLLEKAGYVEQVSRYDSHDDLDLGASNTLLRLTSEPLPVRQLAFDEKTLQRRQQHERDKLQRMVSYAKTRQCRRQKILGYFGERWDKEQCGACDNCRQDSVWFAGTATAAHLPSEDEWLIIQKILSCVARMRGYYGRSKVIQVLLGSQSREIRDTHLGSLSTYGILKGMPRPFVEGCLDALIATGCILIQGEEYPRLELSPFGQEVMRRQKTVEIALPAFPTTVSSGHSPRPVQAAAVTLPQQIPSLTPTVVMSPTQVAQEGKPDPVLLERLRIQRLDLARAEQKRAFQIMSNRTLQAVAVALPTDHAAFLRVHGIGAVTARKYGDIFITLIRAYLAENRQLL